MKIRFIAMAAVMGMSAVSCNKDGEVEVTDTAPVYMTEAAVSVTAEQTAPFEPYGGGGSEGGDEEIYEAETTYEPVDELPAEDYDEYYSGPVLPCDREVANSLWYPEERKSDRIADRLIYNVAQYYSGHLIYRDNSWETVPNAYYGEDKYIEFIADYEKDHMTAVGFIDFLPMDDDIYGTMAEAERRERFMDCHYSAVDGLELIDEDKKRDISYYRVPAEIAATRQELFDYIGEYHVEGFFDNRDLDKELFGGGALQDVPLFAEDDDGLVMASYYRGVPTTYEADTMRLVSSDGSTARVTTMGHSIDLISMRVTDLINVDGKWLVSREEHYDAGSYFGLSRQVYSDAWFFLNVYVDPYRPEAGDDIPVHFRAFANVTGNSVYTDENGLPCSLYFVKEEDYDENADLMAGLENKTAMKTVEGTWPEYSLRPEEEGNYLLSAGWKIEDVNGNVHEVTAGPVRIIVR